MSFCARKLDLCIYGITIRLVEETDAPFIVGLRNAPGLSKYISESASTNYDQVKWIKEYKQRESLGKEYYFVVEDRLSNTLGTIRLYNLSNNRTEVGSWVFMKNAPSGAAIKAYIFCTQIAFEMLECRSSLLNVRKKNIRVLRFHLSFNPKIIDEDEQDLYFELDKDDFYKRAFELLSFYGFEYQSLD